MGDFSLANKRIFLIIPLVVIFGCLLAFNYSLAQDTATTTPEAPPPPPPPPITITINNPDTLPAQSKRITATTNRGILSFSVMDNAGMICSGGLGEFSPYEDFIFDEQAQNGQQVCFKATDGSESVYKAANPVAGIDTTPATLELRGIGDPIVYLGESYSDLGAIATDDFDGSLPISIISGSVNTNVVDDYLLTYGSVTDRAGNIANGLTRLVKVRARPVPEAVNTNLKTATATTTATTTPTATIIHPVTKIVYCSSITYGEWLPCENGLQFRDVVIKSPENCFFTSLQQVNKARNCQTPAVNYCTNVFYAKWGPCVNSFQARSILSQVPVSCVVTAHQQSFTTKACSAVLGQKVVAKKYPNGSLLRGSKNIYLIVGGKKYRLKNVKELWAYRRTKTVQVTADVLAQYPDIDKI